MDTPYRKNMKNGVVYTCLIGNYDFLKHFPIIEKNWDYVCFTDLNIQNDPQWIIKPLSFNKLDSARNYRWHKTHPHILFPEYKQSLFLDANIWIKSHWIFDQIKKYKKNNNIILAKHFKNKCLYQEYEDCKITKKDDFKIMTAQINKIKNDGFPKNMGLSEANVIFRKHNQKEIKKSMEDWWWWINNFSKRDQLSLHYVLWKNKIIPNYFSDKSLRLMTNDFLIIPHNDDLLNFFSKNESITHFSYKRSKNQNEIIKKLARLKEIESSKFFKLWPVYNKIKKIIK